MLLHKWIHAHDNQQGAIFVLFAVTFAFLMAFSAIAVDMGTVYVQKEHLQNAADAAALAGAAKLDVDITNAENCKSITENYIKKYVESNEDATVGNSESTAYDDSSKKININATYATTNTSPLTKTVTVELRRRMPLYFMKYFGFSTMPVEVTATGQYLATTTSTSSGTSPFSIFSNAKPFKNYTMFAGAKTADSIYTNTPNTSITGNIYTNGQIDIANSGAVRTTRLYGEYNAKTDTYSGIGSISGNSASLGNTQHSIDIYSQYTQTAWWPNPEYTDNAFLAGSSNELINGVNITSNYYDITQNSTESDMVDIYNYINNTVIKNSAYTKISQNHDNNLYKGNIRTGTDSDYTSTSTGDQVYYSTDYGTTIINLEKVFKNTNDVSSTNSVPMFTTGDGTYGYNIIITNGAINATSKIADYIDDDPANSAAYIIISLNGDISLQNDKGHTFHGILYAPNGTVRVDGSGKTFFGSIVANKIQWTTSNQTIVHSGVNGRGSNTNITTTGSISLIK